MKRALHSYSCTLPTVVWSSNCDIMPQTSEVFKAVIFPLSSIVGSHTIIGSYSWHQLWYCLQLSRSFLSSDLRACAGLAGLLGPKSEFGRGGVRVHRRAQQNQERRRDAGAHLEMARALYSLRCCPCAPSFAGRGDSPWDQINVEIDGMYASSD